MDPVVNAALETWSPNLPAVAAIVFTAAIYFRGWNVRRRLIRRQQDASELAAFLAGLGALAIALASPLDALDPFFLSAHMTQHLLLLMVAPPLLLLGQPLLPLLRGLPRRFVKDGLGPFLASPALRKFGNFLTSMPVTWLLFALSTLLWHTPRLYELALHSSDWHAAQHASFFWSGILFWWPVILQHPAKRRWPEWTAIPYLLFSDIVNTALSAYFIFSGSVLYPSYQANHVSALSPGDDQALAGAIMWVPGSLIYLLPAIYFAMRILKPGSVEGQNAVRMPRGIAPSRVNSARHLPAMRRGIQYVMLCLAVFVIAEGFRGTQVAPLNAAGVLTWIYWRALAVMALLLVGNLFCAVCPFVLVRDFGRRILPARLRWPHWLRNKWLPAGLLVIYLWAYEAFSLWNKPGATAWLIVGYFAAALAIDGVFRGASFCKYVCPIGQFHFVTSLISPREVKVKEQSVCNTCRTYDCIRGNAQARGCELELFQPKKESNLDCTFCLDCVKACPHDNVALLPVLPAETLLTDNYRSSLRRLSGRTDYVWLALVITFGAFVNAAGMIGPVMTMEHRWHAHLGADGMKWAVAIFTVLGAVLFPATLLFACRLFLRDRRLTNRLLYTLVPLGVAMWAAHLLYHLITVADSGLPSWTTPLQILLLDAGVLLTFYLGWRLVSQRVRILLPWSAFALGLYALGVWTLLQPMDMRGMMH